MLNARCIEALLCLEAKKEPKEKVKFWDRNPHKRRSTMACFCLFDFYKYEGKVVLLGAWPAVGGGVWIGGAGRAGALSLPPYVCAVTWWQLQALIWLAPGFLGWFWRCTGGQAGRKEWDG